MQFTKEQLAKAKSAKNAEELIALAKENGIELTEDEAKKYFEQGELSDDELDNVVGGCGDPHEKHLSWNEQSYPMEHRDECPVCGEHLTFVRGGSCSPSRSILIYHCPVGNVDFRVDWLGEHNGYFFTRI